VTGGTLSVFAYNVTDGTLSVFFYDVTDGTLSVLAYNVTDGTLNALAYNVTGCTLSVLSYNVIGVRFSLSFVIRRTHSLTESVSQRLSFVSVPFVVWQYTKNYYNQCQKTALYAVLYLFAIWLQ
jgi:hypothetical protein